MLLPRGRWADGCRVDRASGAECVAVYRAAFLTALARRVPGGVDVIVGDALFEATVRTAELLPVPATRVRNLYLAGRRLSWQRRVLFPGVKADVAILELNPRILTVWATVVARRALRRPTILWGHAWPRRGRGAPTDRVRSLLRREASVLVTYTETQAQELRAALPGRPVLAAPNARPLTLEEDSFVANWGRRRLDLRPGITGTWQVSGRTEIPFEEMVRLGYLYATSSFPWNDVRLILRRLPTVVQGGAG